MRFRICASPLAWFLVLALACGCSSGPEPSPVRLPSGRTIKVVGIGPIRFGSGETGLILTYQTDLKVSDQVALRNEIEDIWPSFRIEAEKAKVHSAIITASETPEGAIIKQSHQYNFVFQKSDDGTWHMLENQGTKQEAQPGTR